MRQSIIIDFKSKNGPVIKKTTTTTSSSPISTPSKTSSPNQYVGKRVAPEFLNASAASMSPLSAATPASSPTSSQKVGSLEEREAVLTEDITKNLVKMNQL